MGALGVTSKEELLGALFEAMLDLWVREGSRVVPSAIARARTAALAETISSQPI
jgi:hypothetical protein